MPEEKPAPNNHEIDELCQLYLDAENAVEIASNKKTDLAAQIIDLIKKHGALPARAKKSRRIEGDEYQATFSKGHSVEVSTQKTFAFRTWCRSFLALSFFYKLFKAETVYVLREGADELVAQRAEKIARKHPETAEILLARFHRCLDIKDTSPKLTVEPRKKDEKKKEFAA